MSHSKISKLFLTLVLAAASLVSPSAFAQAWPNKPVRWIVPFAPGGPADVLARTVAQKLSEKWGHAVVVDNKIQLQELQ